MEPDVAHIRDELDSFVFPDQFGEEEKWLNSSSTATNREISQDNDA